MHFPIDRYLRLYVYILAAGFEAHFIGKDNRTVAERVRTDRRHADDLGSGVNKWAFCGEVVSCRAGWR